MRKCKLRPGVGCKATFLTKFIHPKQNNIDASHRSTVVLLSNEKKTVGRKSQECYTFRFVDGNNSDIFYAVKTHFKIIEEGRNEDFFDSVSAGEIRVEAQSKKFKEPKMKWRKSKAKRILYNALLEGIIPVHDKNFQQMSLKDVYCIDPELALYDISLLLLQGNECGVSYRKSKHSSTRKSCGPTIGMMTYGSSQWMEPTVGSTNHNIQIGHRTENFTHTNTTRLA
ncbi:hypothetical protein IV203_037024 [Nitzschia inconspicua]|uniref:Uncharacterized protein n=1 Tax=Nitzschia inconspicua TaxID=303405 RepID=A0A9K3PY01_9STRA|nr:hypothetical protein IV203_037024 [Nitzschia inconspicua]